MTRITHPDNWVRIPAGPFLTGVSESQHQDLTRNFEQRLSALTKTEQETLLSALKKDYEMAATPEPQRSQLLELQRAIEAPGTSQETRESTRSEMWRIKDTIPRGLGRIAETFTDEELRLKYLYRHKLKPLRLDEVANIEMSMLVPSLGPFPKQTESNIGEFYIARFSITERQYHNYEHGTPAAELGGALDEPMSRIATIRGREREIFLRDAAAVTPEVSGQLLEELGARYPTSEEWEKAAIGEDGRLYPWGDEWNPTAGYFYYGQDETGPDGRGVMIVDAFPDGVGPYGVWSMVGGLPELVMALPSEVDLALRPETDPKERKLGLKGVHARESSREFAWLDHIVAWRGRGDWVSLRPVLDEWPVQSCTGVDLDAEEPQDPATEAI